MTAVSRDRLGAWLLRCNPARHDLASRYVAPISTWCVTDNYRSRLIAPRDPVLLWLSGRDRHFVRGIWGQGLITAPAEWSDSGLQVGLHLALEREALVTDAELRAAGIDDLEVQRMPQGSNPSWISSEQMARVDSIARSDRLVPWESAQWRSTSPNTRRDSSNSPKRA